MRSEKQFFTEALQQDRGMYSETIQTLCLEEGFIIGDMDEPIQGYLVFDCEDDGLVGFILFKTQKRTVVITRLFVKSTHRGLHLSRYLIFMCTRDASECEDIALSSQDDAIPFWIHNGFTMTNQEDNIMMKKNPLHSTIQDWTLSL